MAENYAYGLADEMELDSKYLIPTFSRYEVEFVEGAGMYLHDSDGNKYLDFLAGIGVCSLGHCNPTVVEAIKTQAQRLIHVGNYFYIDGRGSVAEKLSNMIARSYNSADYSYTNTNQVWKTFFANSGAEANECAIKLARAYYSETRNMDSADSIIVALERSFHGRTIATLKATGQTKFHEGFEPLPPGFAYVPINDIDAIESMFEQFSDRICAVFVECIQGESGVNLCTSEFLSTISTLCRKNDALMIVDEVQTGIFRTGLPFAFQHFEIVPDIVTSAKGIASGMPAGACSARSDIADVLTAGRHGSTFGGSNLAIAASLATLFELDSQSTINRVISVGEYLRKRMLEAPHVLSTRGIGLMCAAELEIGIDAHDVVLQGIENGIIMNAPTDTTIRLLPPLICTEEDVDIFIEVFKDTLSNF